MTRIKSFFTFKVGFLTFVGIFAVASGVLALTPRHVNVVLSDSCENAPQVATLNPFSYSYQGFAYGADCFDFPPLLAKNLTQGGSYPQSVSEHSAGIQARAGDEIMVRLWAHNGAELNQGLVAQNVRGAVTVDGNPEPEHVIGVTLSSDNTNSVAGSIAIHTGADEHLEVVPGSGQFYDHFTNPVFDGSANVSGDAFTVNFGNLEACYEFARFFTFKIRVVSKPAPPPIQPSGNISASVKTDVCPAIAHIDWSTQNAQEQGLDVAVFRNDTQLVSGGYSGSKDLADGQAGQTYTFSIWRVDWNKGGDIRVGSEPIARSNAITLPACGGNPPPAPGSGNITYSNIRQTPNQCLYSVDVAWTLNNIDSHLVTVSDPLKDSNNLYSNDKPFTGVQSGNSGSGIAPWLTSGFGYRFTLWEVNPASDGQNIIFQGGSTYKVRHLDETWVPAQAALTCGSNPPPPPALVCAPLSSTLDINQAQTFTATGGDPDAGVYQWLIDGVLRAQGFNSIDRSFSTSGSHTAQVKRGSQTATCNVTVRAANVPVCPSGVSAQVSPSSIKVGEFASISAPSGFIGGSFSSSNSSVANVVGSSLRGNSPGSASISGSGFTAPNGATNCGLNPATINVFQNPPSPGQLACSANPSSVEINQSTLITVTGGVLPYNFSAPGASSASLTPTTDTLRYFSPGLKTITVTSADGQQTQCSVNVTQLPPPAPVCPSGVSAQVSPSSIKVGEFASISAPSGFIGGSFSSSNSSVANVVGSSLRGNSPGSASISGSGFTAPNGATNCGLNPVTVTVTQLPPPAPVCPTDASVILNPSIIFVGDFSSASAPAGFSGGSFSSSNAAVADFVDGLRGTSLKGFAEGSASISGSGFTAPNGASNCVLNSTRLTVRKQPVTPPAEVSATATARASAAAFAFCPDGSQASASASAEATATASASTLADAQKLAFDKAFAQAQALAFAQAQAKVVCRETPPPPPPVPQLICSPAFQSVDIGQNANFTATGGTGEFNWSAPFGRTTSGTGSHFTTQFSTAGDKVVTLTSGNQSKVCQISVNQPPVPGQPNLSITKEVRNLGPSQTTGFATSINAKKNDTVQYRITVRNTGNTTARDGVVSDSNPIGINLSNFNATRSFGGGIQYGLHIGDLAAGESVVITYNATVSLEQGEIRNQATVSATNAASDRAIAIVNVIKDTAAATTGGDCNNNSNSCNHNTNNNTQTNNNSTNSSNQGNQNNLNGNNNTVTNTNQNCVNNSCNRTNIVYISQTGSTVPGNDFRQLAITKLVRHINGGAFQDSVTANSNETVEFEVVVRNTGNQVVNNAQMTDTWNGNLSLVSGTLRVDGNYAGDNLNNISLGSLLSGQQKRVTFQARVFASGSQSIQNIARAWGDNTGQVQDDAWVFVNNVVAGCTVNCGNVQGSSVNLVYSKRANNETKNAGAGTVIASREDFITYTLTVTNTGNAPAGSFIITDDLSQVLPYADMTDNGGGILSGNVIAYPGITVPAGGSVSKSFRVRVKFHLAANLSYTMVNTYGNTVTVRINTPQVLGAFVAPKTGGPSVELASIFGALMAGAFGVIRHRRKVWELIWN